MCEIEKKNISKEYRELLLRVEEEGDTSEEDDDVYEEYEEY